jgi:alkylresorcinol/alkylpyrone synthase
MPIIRALATKIPPYVIPQTAIRDAAHTHFSPAFPQIERYLPVFRNAQIDTRAFAVPLEWFAEPRSFKECNDLFIRAATELGTTAAQACLAQAGIQATDIDHLIWVSTTGMAAPSPDALLINRLAMRPTTRRTPIWGLGCAGGVAGLARACEYVLAYPSQRALLLNVELCSVTFQWQDRSRRNLIAASLFADGASAVLIEGDHFANPSQPGPQVIGTQSILWPGTPEIMGWDMVDTGMQVVFSARIPGIIATEMRAVVSAFLAQYGLELADIQHWVLHPGGAKVISAYQEALGLDAEQLLATCETLRQYGNMSSATIFFVLQHFLRQQKPEPGAYALLAVLGPGFSCELALIKG